MSRPETTDVLTVRQRVVYATVLARDGNITAAAADLGVSSVSAGDTYRRAVVRLDPSYAPPPRPLTPRKVTAMLPDRLAAIEAHLASLLASQAAMSVQLTDLAAEILAWTSRQPIYVEVRPRHDRKVDGGLGGVRETRELRRVVSR